MNQRAIVPSNNYGGLAILDKLDSLKSLAGMLRSTGMLPDEVKTDEQAMLIMMQAAEMGIGFVTAFNNTSVIRKRATPGWQLLLAMAQGSGEMRDFRVEFSPDNQACTVTIWRGSWSAPYTVTHTIQDAAKLGLTKKDNWQAQPKNMLLGFTVKAALKVVFADYIKGVQKKRDEQDAEVYTLQQDNFGRTEVVVRHENASQGLLDAEDNSRWQGSPPPQLPADASGQGGTPDTPPFAPTATATPDERKEVQRKQQEQKPPRSQQKPPPASRQVNNTDVGYVPADVYSATSEYFDSEGDLMKWLSQAIGSKLIERSTPTDRVIELVREKVHVMSAAANRQRLNDILKTNDPNFDAKRFLAEAVPGKTFTRLSEMPNDLNWLLSRAAEIAGVSLDGSPAPAEAPVEDVTEGEFSETDDQTPESAVPASEYWTDVTRAAFDAEVERAFPDHSAQQILNAVEADYWTLPIDLERESVRKHAIEGKWRVYCDTVSRQGDYIAFHTYLGEMRYYSTTEFAKLLPEGWVRANDVPGWKELKAPRTIEPLVLSWMQHTRKGDNTPYMTVVGVEALDPIDSKLEL